VSVRDDGQDEAASEREDGDSGVEQGETDAAADASQPGPEPSESAEPTADAGGSDAGEAIEETVPAEGNGTEEPASAEGDATEEPAPEVTEEPAPVEAHATEEPAPEATEEPTSAEGEATEEAASPADEADKTGAPPSSEKKAPKAKDLAPGADLDPIAITTERELTAEERARVEAEAEERETREAVAGLGDDEAAPEDRKTVSVPADAHIQATGKRKRAVARVVLRSGDGNVSINDRALEEYFPRAYHRTLALQPLVAAGYDSSVDISVRVHGGGIGGQAGAVRHGIARALCEVDPELRGELKRRGMLTRDARMKERRKAGLKKARKRPQFSKR
jgi:small subunit ribosomal protein S9